MSYEKLYVEIFLVILLLILLNSNIPLLTNLSSDTSGKIILVLLISFLSLRYGTTCGLLGTFIYLLLNNKYKEGMSPQEKQAKQKRKKPTKCSKDRDCGACQYKCDEGQCKAEILDGSRYIKESFVGSRTSGFDRETAEDKIHKKPILNTISASCP